MCDFIITFLICLYSLDCDIYASCWNINIIPWDYNIKYIHTYVYINGVSSNPVEGRTKIWQLKDLILTVWFNFQTYIYIYIYIYIINEILQWIDCAILNIYAFKNQILDNRIHLMVIHTCSEVYILGHGFLFHSNFNVMKCFEYNFTFFKLFSSSLTLQ